ncbi:ubiquitin-conjugating enzyme E2 J1 isoform X1 [Pseudophryne corroboree]|uniref:ubiquitin-conjugating enzyme E2 J1 isoform X1 n=2 Tax=Pseudophryne corroboree TaxID=495146 RepID=UPI003082033E
MEGRYNLKSPAVKRLMKEAAELKDATDHYHAQPLEDNLFEWHFTVRGPPESDFDGGVYHGRIVLPPEYPMKPPSIILLTANGRFEIGKKICLSISGHHPETWQPSWSIRTALLAIIGFMPTKGEGAIGSLDYTPEERKALAKKSQDYFCETCGMSMKSALLPLNSESSCDDREARELARQISFTVNPPGGSRAEGNVSSQPQKPPGADQLSDTTSQVEAQYVEATHGEEAAQPAPALNVSRSPRQRRVAQSNNLPSPSLIQVQQHAVNGSSTGSVLLIIVLTLAFAALFFRRIYLANGYIFDYEL